MPAIQSLLRASRCCARPRSASYPLLFVATLFAGSATCQAAPAGDGLLSWAHWADSAGRAARDSGTWMPLAGAVAIAAGGWDHAWQRSLGKHQYLFGNDGEDASNQLLQASTVLYATSVVFAAPDDQAFTDALDWKAANIATFVASKTSVDELTGQLKEVSGRERPDGVKDDAMPSRHSATSAAETAMTRRNLDYIDMNPTLRDAAKIGLHTLDGLTGLARMEADQHYPTDVLAGIALGNFVSNFAFNLLLEPDEPHAYQLSMVPAFDGYALQTRVAF